MPRLKAFLSCWSPIDKISWISWLNFVALACASGRFFSFWSAIMGKTQTDLNWSNFCTDANQSVVVLRIERKVKACERKAEEEYFIPFLFFFPFNRFRTHCSFFRLLQDVGMKLLCKTLARNCSARRWQETVVQDVGKKLLWKGTAVTMGKNCVARDDGYIRVKLHYKWATLASGRSCITKGWQ